MRMVRRSSACERARASPVPTPMEPGTNRRMLRRPNVLLKRWRSHGWEREGPRGRNRSSLTCHALVRRSPRDKGSRWWRGPSAQSRTRGTSESLRLSAHGAISRAAGQPLSARRIAYPSAPTRAAGGVARSSVARRPLAVSHGLPKKPSCPSAKTTRDPADRSVGPTRASAELWLEDVLSLPDPEARLGFPRSRSWWSLDPRSGVVERDLDSLPEPPRTW